MAKLYVNAKNRKGKISKEIYGHFSEHLGRCIYEGLYVGEDSDIPNKNGMRIDVVEALKEMKVPVLRWPGGCFADEYHWKDGIGKKSTRKKMVNTNWGGVTEDNSFGTHEFMELCELVGCQPYITGNVGSGTVKEMSEWIEYMTFDGVSPMADLRKTNGREVPWKLKYFGIGNENWGCGGSMRPEMYADEYRKFQSYCKNYSGNILYKIACGPTTADYNWTEKIMQNLDANMVQAIDLHYYTMPIWPEMYSATKFNNDEYYNTISGAMYFNDILKRHIAIMDRYDPDNKIDLIVGEWGCWYSVEPDSNPGFLYQQNTMRDAIVAAYHLNIFNRYSKRVSMANLAQIVNVLQAIILTEGEKMIKTPTYHVFDLFKEHQNADAVYCYCDNVNVCDGKNIPMISSSASVKDGTVILTLSNCSLEDEAEIECNINGFNANDATARILTNDAHAYNDFDTPENVKINDYTVSVTNGTLKVNLPACSVVTVTLNQ